MGYTRNKICLECLSGLKTIDHEIKACVHITDFFGTIAVIQLDSEIALFNLAHCGTKLLDGTKEVVRQHIGNEYANKQTDQNQLQQKRRLQVLTKNPMPYFGNAETYQDGHNHFCSNSKNQTCT